MESKIRICLAVLGDINKEKVWSGTDNTLFEKLSQRDDVDIEVLNYGAFASESYKKYKIWRKYTYTWNSAQDIIFRKFYRKCFLDAISCMDMSSFDWILFPAMICPFDVLDNINAKVALYTDSLMSDLDDYRNYKPFKFLSSYFYKKNLKNDLNKIDVLFTQNEWSKNRFISLKRISVNNCYNVNFGVNLQPYFGEKKYDDSLLIILRKGNERLKGLKLLLEAFPLVKEKLPNVILHIVGTDYGAKMEGVRCYYNMPRSITEGLLRRCTLYVMPSLREPNGITYLEALANKSPIVGLDRFGFPEFSGNGEWGFILEKESPRLLADTICKALSNKKQLKSMGMKGQQFVVENFSWDKTVEQMVMVMKNNI